MNFHAWAVFGLTVSGFSVWRQKFWRHMEKPKYKLCLTPHRLVFCLKIETLFGVRHNLVFGFYMWRQSLVKPETRKCLTPNRLLFCWLKIKICLKLPRSTNAIHLGLALNRWSNHLYVCKVLFISEDTKPLINLVRDLGPSSIHS